MRRVLTLTGLLVLALLGTGCGGSGDNGSQSKKSGDPQPDNPYFHLKADVNRYNGPVPLKVKFSSKPFNATGKVLYRWRFDDGTTSREQNPTHTFSEAGYYQVIMLAEDEKGHSDAWNLILSALPPDAFSATHNNPSKREIRQAIRDQNIRTGERRKKHPLRAPTPPR
jgi:hypothetical protein